MNYVYDNPVDNGYVEMYLSNKQLKQLGLHKHYWNTWRSKTHVFYNHKQGVFILERLVRAPLTILNLLLFPINCLFYGVLEYKNVWNDTKELLFQRESGCYRKDMVQGKQAEEWIDKLIQMGFYM